MSSMMTAISARCRIASPRLPSEQGRLISSHNRDSRRSQAWRRMHHNRIPTELLMRASVRVRAIVAGLQIGKIGKAIAFPIVFRDQIAPSPSGLKVIGTIGKTAMVVRGISAIPRSPSQPSREGGADAVASPALPPFITESPRPNNNNNNVETTTAEPSPDAIASPTPDGTAEASPPVFEFAVGRQRLSSQGPSTAATIALWVWQGRFRGIRADQIRRQKSRTTRPYRNSCFPGLLGRFKRK